MNETSDEKLIKAVVEEMRDCFEQYCLLNISYMLTELLEEGVDNRRVLADFVRQGLYSDDSSD